ncbi:hypothetical protein GCM10028805_36060 [Spirosoma harenae]
MKTSFCSYTLLAGLSLVAFTGCQKMDKPVLGDYQTDSPIAGDLKFYAPLDNNLVEDLKKAIGSSTDVAFVDGVNGKAIELKKSTSAALFKTSNDFKNSTSFSVSYWAKMGEPTLAGAHFFFSNPSTAGVFSTSSFFQLHEDKGQSNGGLLTTKFYVFDNWCTFEGEDRILGVMDNQWHHWAMTYNETTSLLSIYVDGKSLPKTFTLKKGDANLGKADLSKSTKFVIGSPPGIATGAANDSWMVPFEGSIDQFRLYSKALSAAEITELYIKKQ